MTDDRIMPGGEFGKAAREAAIEELANVLTGIVTAHRPVPEAQITKIKGLMVVEVGEMITTILAKPEVQRRVTEILRAGGTN